MNKIKRFSVSLAALLLFSSIAMVAPVSARDGHSGTSSDDSTIADNTTTTETDNQVNDLTEQFRQQAREKLTEARKTAKAHTQAERERACTARKNNLTKRMSNAVAQAERHKAVFDKIYTRVKDFYTTKQLNVTDYATLTAKVDTAQTDAQNSIDALKALDVSVDCTSQNVADSVSTFQQAVKSTRDSLKAYRKSLVELITSLKGASTGAHASGDTSDTQTTNTTTQ